MSNRPQRIQRKRTKGWRMPENTVSVMRPGPWGNPFVAGKKPDKRLLRLWGWKLSRWNDVCPSIEEAVRRFRVCIAFDHASHYAAVKELRGKNLACWCPLEDQHGNYTPCHADVLLELANAPT